MMSQPPQSQPQPPYDRETDALASSDEDIRQMDAGLTRFQQMRSRFLLSLPPALRARLMREWGLRPHDLTPPAE